MSKKYLTGNARNKQSDDDPNFYPTCYAALPPLLVAEGKRFPKTIWEPACGNGALVIPLRNRGFNVVATDLHNWGCPDSTTGVDFLSDVSTSVAAQTAIDFGSFGIMTNPPFNLAEEFIDRATALSPYVAVLCRLAFFESEGRMNWFPQVGLSRVHIIGERLPMMHKHGYEGPKLSAGGMAFAWFIFEQQKRRKIQVPVRWVSWKQACRRFPQTDQDTPPEATDTLPLFAAAE